MPLNYFVAKVRADRVALCAQLGAIVTTDPDGREVLEGVRIEPAKSGGVKVSALIGNVYISALDPDGVASRAASVRFGKSFIQHIPQEIRRRRSVLGDEAPNDFVLRINGRSDSDLLEVELYPLTDPNDRLTVTAVEIVAPDPAADACSVPEWVCEAA